MASKKKVKKSKPDVALVLCPVFDPEMPHMGIAYLSSYLSSKGYDNLILDFNLDLYENDKYKPFWGGDKIIYWTKEAYYPKVLEIFDKEIDNCVKRILDTEIDIVGFSVIHTNPFFSVEVAKRLKKQDKDIKIIFGGAWCWYDKFFPITDDLGLIVNEDTLKVLMPRGIVDYFVVGDGEETLLEIVESIKNNEPVRNIAGAIVYDKKKDKYLKFRSRPSLDLNELPFPTYENFDLSRYKGPEFPLVSSKGCSWKCTFCNNPGIMKYHRSRTGENLFNEVEYHVQKNKKTAFRFNDLLVNGNLEHLKEFCDLVHKNRYRIYWSGNALIKQDMDYEFLASLKRGGCASLVFGLESGSDTTLKLMRKNFTAADAERIFRINYKLGINNIINIVVGFPGETEKEFQETLNFLKRNKKYISKVVNLNILEIIWDSELRYCPEKYGIVLPDPQETCFYKWYIKDGSNTLEIRKKRIKKAMELLDKLGLYFQKTNFFAIEISKAELEKYSKIQNMLLQKYIKEEKMKGELEGKGLFYRTHYKLRNFLKQDDKEEFKNVGFSSC